MIEGRDWQRRRRERAITRLTERMARLRGEIEVLDAQVSVVAEDAEHAAMDAVVRPGDAPQREAGRAAANADSHRRLLAEHRATLDDLRRRRDALLDQL